MYVCVIFWWLKCIILEPQCLGIVPNPSLKKILTDSEHLSHGYIMEIITNVIHIRKLVRLVQRMKH